MDFELFSSVHLSCVSSCTKCAHHCIHAEVHNFLQQKTVIPALHGDCTWFITCQTTAETLDEAMSVRSCLVRINWTHIAERADACCKYHDNKLG